MFTADVCGFMAVHANQRHLDLERTVCENSRQLRLRIDLGRHKVYDDDLERTDILRVRPGLLHRKYIFILQRFRCR